MAQLVSAEQRWNGLVERAEFYEELVGERDDDRGAATRARAREEEEGQYRTGEGKVRGRRGVQEESSFPFLFPIMPRRRWER